MQCAAWREGLLDRPLTTLIVMVLLVAGLASQAESQTDPPSPAYVAFRVEASTTPAQRRELLRKVKEAGLEPLENDALERAGLLVFETGRLAVRDDAPAVLRHMEPVPVTEFRGVLSVPTGSFYLRFQEDVAPAVARKRVEALGFKVVTPAADSSSLLVVEGSKRPLDRQQELQRLRQLDQLMFVAPHDIALPTSGSRPR
jgi:hypothetical protein